MRRYLPTYRRCFVCGTKNSLGLHVRPFVEDNQVVIEFTPREEHMGFKNVVHGGIVASLMDEASFWVATLASHKVCVTAQMRIRYTKPLSVGTPTITSAQLVRREGHRRIIVEAHSRDRAGNLYASATSTFVIVPGDLKEAFSDDPSIAGADLQQYSIRPE